jgi:hypothetical protein
MINYLFCNRLQVLKAVFYPQTGLTCRESRTERRIREARWYKKMSRLANLCLCARILRGREHDREGLVFPVGAKRIDAAWAPE